MTRMSGPDVIMGMARVWGGVGKGMGCPCFFIIIINFFHLSRFESNTRVIELHKGMAHMYAI